VPGDKRQLAVAGGVLMVLSAGAADAAAHNAANAANAGASSGGQDDGVSFADASCALSLYDLRARVLAHAAPLPDVAHALLARAAPTCHDLAAPCRVTVLLASSSSSSASSASAAAPAPSPGGAFELRERDTPAKVEALLKRSLYPTALALLTAENAPASALGDVRRRFGDHLAAKRDYEGALAQWVATIGGGQGGNEGVITPSGAPSSSGVPPSHIIRALLDARRPGDVARYLEALHAAGCAGAEHTTLLLHCYAAGKEAGKLDAFLAGTATIGTNTGIGTNGIGTNQPLIGTTPEAYRARFDVPSVLRVVRAAGYPSAALGVATRAGDAAARLEILLDDMSAFDDALRLLEALPPHDADAGFARYGRRLLAARPGGTAAALLRSVARAARGSGGGGAGLRRAAALAPLFAARPRALLRFLTRSLDACASASAASSDDATPADAAAAAAVHNTLLELLLSQRLDADAAALAADAGADATHAHADAAADAAANDGDDGDAEDDAAARADAALRLLREAWPAGRSARYDAPHALVLCQTAFSSSSSSSSSAAGSSSSASASASYARGVRFLLERLRLFPELLRSHAAAGDARGLLDAATRLGARADASLWRDALAHLADATLAADAGSIGTNGASFAASASSSHGGEIQEALEHIERARLLPPLAALSALARNPALPLALARGFVARALAAEAAAAAADGAAAARLGAETSRMRAELRELRTTPRVFQNSRCALCAQSLDAPAAHFLCMHSFHTRCLAENERCVCAFSFFFFVFPLFPSRC
jgi:hypothetical protein